MRWVRASSILAKGHQNRAQSSRNRYQRADHTMNVAAEHIRRNLGSVKEKVLDKLAAAKVPKEALDNARNFLETLTVAAQGITRETLYRIKLHLVEILPSISPTLTRKMVDEAATEVKAEDEEQEAGSGGSRVPYVSPASSFFALLKPFSRL